MREFLFVLLAVSSTAALVALGTVSWLVSTRKSALMLRLAIPRGAYEPSGLSHKEIAMLLLALVAFLACIHQGASAMLSWMPNSWGRLEDGEWQTLRFSLASLLSLAIGIPLIGALVDVTTEHVSHRNTAERAQYLERVLETSMNPDALEILRKELEEKRDTLGPGRSRDLLNERRRYTYVQLIALTTAQLERLRARQSGATT